jgi:hypothetical protein
MGAIGPVASYGGTGRDLSASDATMARTNMLHNVMRTANQILQYRL